MPVRKSEMILAELDVVEEKKEDENLLNDIKKGGSGLKGPNEGVFVDDKLKDGMYPTFDGSENKPMEHLEKFDLHPNYESQSKGTPVIKV